MPQTTHTPHPKDPSLILTFTEEDHRYIDSNGQVYVSASSIIHDQFEPFDAEANAKRMAARDGGAWQDLIAQWKAKADAACAYGTRCHEFAEYLLMDGKSGVWHAAANPKEKIAFDCVANAARMLQDRFELIKCEIVLFDPCAAISGTCDLLMRAKDGRYLLLDFKTNEKLHKECYRMGKGIFANIEDTPLGHYSIQLSIYECMLRGQGHVPEHAAIDRAIIYIPPMQDRPQWIPMPFVEAAKTFFQQ